MFDIWIDWAKKKMFGKYYAEAEDLSQSKFHRGIMKFLTQIMPSILSSVLVFLGFLYIFNKAYEKYGINRMILVFGIIYMLSLRSIIKILSQATKD